MRGSLSGPNPMMRTAATLMLFLAGTTALCFGMDVHAEAKSKARPDFSGFWVLDESLHFSGGNGPPDLVGGWRGFGSFRNNPQPPLQRHIYEEVRDRRNREMSATDLQGGLDEQTALCGPGGFPDLLEFFDPLDIHQRDDELIMLTERERQLPRHIYITPRHVVSDQYLPSKTGVTSNNGHSLGHWEGNSLVVKTDGVDAGPWMFSIDRIPHSDALQATERLSLSPDGKVLTDVLTIIDPKVLVQPWTLTLKWNRAPPDTEAIESVCVRDAEAPGLKDSTPVRQ